MLHTSGFARCWTQANLCHSILKVRRFTMPVPALPSRDNPSVLSVRLRVDAYSPRLIQQGLRVMIGKGSRSEEVIDALKEHTGVYFAAIGGAAALMAKAVKEAEVIAFDELGTEAIRRLRVEELPVIVAIDHEGNDMYKLGVEKYRQ